MALKAEVCIKITVVIMAVLLLGVFGCSNPGSPSPPDSQNPQWVSAEIYFGRNIPAGGEVSEQQFADFLTSEVTPAFPAGLTVYDTYGQMQNSNGEIVKQKTKVVLLVYENSGANTAAVKKIISTYRSNFGSPQVMLTTQPIIPEFYGN